MTENKPSTNLIDNYTNHLRYHNYAHNTILSYTRDVQALYSYLQLNEQTLQDAQIDNLRGWLAYGCRSVDDSYKIKPLKAQSVKRRIYAIRSFFRWLKAEGHRADNPSLRLRTPKTPRDLPRYLTIEQATQLVEHPVQENWFQDRNRALIELLYASGIRVSEAHKLDVTDVDILDRSVRVFGKGRKERVVFFTPPAKQALKIWLAHLDGTGPLFRNMFGDRLSARGIRIICKKTGIKNGIFGLHPHMLRHTCATHVLMGKMKLPSIQKLLGHTSIAATERYLHTASDAFREIQSQHPLAVRHAKINAGKN